MITINNFMFNLYLLNYRKLNLSNDEIVSKLLNMYYLKSYNENIYFIINSDQIVNYIRNNYEIYNKCMEEFDNYLFYDEDLKFENFNGCIFELDEIIKNFCKSYSNDKNIVRFLSEECFINFYHLFKDDLKYDKLDKDENSCC